MHAKYNLSTRLQGNRKLIKLGEQTIDYDERFKLYITTKLSTPHYTPTVSTKVCLLNFAITIDGLDDQMLAIVVGKDESEMEEKRASLVIEQASNNKQLIELENKILKLLSEAQGNILDDEVLINTLQKSKKASKLIEKRMSEAKVIEQQIDNVRVQYSSLSRSAANLFFCITDLGMIDPMYQYSLDWFLNLFVKSIETASYPTESEASKIADTVTVPENHSLILKLRTINIDDEFKHSLYRNVCRSLFEKDKLLFGYLLTYRVLQSENLMNDDEWRFVLTAVSIKGTSSKEKLQTMLNPCKDWLENQNWETIKHLSLLSPEFEGLCDEFNPNSEYMNQWKSFCTCSAPYDFDNSLPKKWSDKLTPLQKLCVLRSMRLDAMIPGIQWFVKESIGEFFIRPPPFDLEGPFMDSDSVTPIVFILSAGSDPMNELLKVARNHEMTDKDKLFNISLGQGQGPIAQKAITDATNHGTWVVLQNCHLAPSWMPVLEKIIENFDANEINPSFRLWLTSMPSKDFPMAILQNGVKITNEPPRGIQANLRQTYQSLDEQWFEGCQRPQEFKKTMFSLAFFHAIVQERRKFGPLGWNIPYQFNESDLRISYAQLQIFLNETSVGSEESMSDSRAEQLSFHDDTIFVPWSQLKYMTGQLNYGGRVTDDKDRRALMTILDTYYTQDLLSNPEFSFDPNGKYVSPIFNSKGDVIDSSSLNKNLDEPAHPSGGSIDNYLSYIQSLPLVDGPDVFGLHSNANISCALQESTTTLDTILSVQSTASTAANDTNEDDDENDGANESDKELTPAERMCQMAHDIEIQLPEIFDIKDVQAKYPVSYNESMNTVLVQELLRFNRLLSVIKDTLRDLQRAVKGEVVMSPELEEIGTSIFNLKVPTMWSNVCYPSLKPLGGWVSDLLDRLQFFNLWIVNGAPPLFWISGFYFTQSFLTGSLQNYARKYTIPIDELFFEFEIVSNETVDCSYTVMENTNENGEIQTLEERYNDKISKCKRPEDGCYVYGLFLQGAGWDFKTNTLCESKPKQLFVNMPIIWFKPTNKKPKKNENENQGNANNQILKYDCPVYKTSRRAGSLSTTGHSTNYVLTVQLPSFVEASHWILRGVAMLTTLDY